MTRQIFFQLLFTALLMLPFTSPGLSAAGTAEEGQVIITTDAGNAELPQPTPALPVSAGTKPPSHKMHVPTMDELAHIHRFHKERLKKIRKHQRKCWLSAKLIIILCHIALLVCGYLHASH